MSGAVVLAGMAPPGARALAIKCAACGEVLPNAHLLASLEELERRPLFVLCEECYVHIRSGYQRDRDLRLNKRGLSG